MVFPNTMHDSVCINAEDQKRVERAEVNYKRWIFDAISPFLGKRILEIGSGSVAITTFFLDKELVVATDTDPLCVQELQSRFSKHKNVVCAQLDIGSEPAAAVLKEHRFDTVVCINVLEHVRDDRAALRNVHGLLPEQGALVLLVPMYPFLFGKGDEEVGHFRRYLRKPLLRLLQESNFGVEKSFYMHSVGIAAWFLFSKILHKREGTGEVSLYDKMVVPLVAGFEKYIPMPFGLSLVCVARKL